MFWIIAVLPVVGMAVFYLLGTTDKHGNEVMNRGTHSDYLRERKRQQLTQVELSTDHVQREAAMIETKRLKAQLNRSLEQAAASITNEKHLKMVDNEMKKRGPHYSRLFDSWMLAEEKAAEVLKLIRERENNRALIRKDFFARGVDFASTAQKRLDAEKAVIGAYILSILGSERYEEFEEIDSQFDLVGKNDPLRD